MTVLSFERYPVDPQRTQEFVALVDKLLEEMRSAPGVLWADATKAFDDEPSYILLGEWRTDADLEAWNGDPSAKAFRDDVDVNLRGEPTRRRFHGA